MKIDLIQLCFIISGAIGTLVTKNYLGEWIGGFMLLGIGGFFGNYIWELMKKERKNGQ